MYKSSFKAITEAKQASKWGWMSLLIIIVIVIYFLVQSISVVEISCCTDKVIFQKIIASDEEITISYQQSLYKVKQEEHFLISKDSFILKKMVFGSYQAYDYYDHDSAGQLVEASNGDYILTNLDYSMKEIRFRNAHYSDHIAKLKNTTINISSLTSRGEVIKINVVNRPRINIIVRGFIL